MRQALRPPRTCKPRWRKRRAPRPSGRARRQNCAPTAARPTASTRRSCCAARSRAWSSSASSIPARNCGPTLRRQAGCSWSPIRRISGSSYVSEKDLDAVRPGAEVRLATGASGDERAHGRITHVADVVDPQTRTIKVRGTVKNSERRLKAEMFVSAEIKVPAGIGLLIPAKAVYLRGEQYFVFVEAGPGTFVRKAVRLAPATDGTSLVLEGISATDKVVTDGNLLLERVLASKD